MIFFQTKLLKPNHFQLGTYYFTYMAILKYSLTTIAAYHIRTYIIVLIM